MLACGGTSTESNERFIPDENDVVDAGTARAIDAGDTPAPEDAGTSADQDAGASPDAGVDAADAGAAGEVGWIGAACDGDSACAPAGAVCLVDESGWPGGTCSLACDLYCPDEAGAAETFCVDDGVGGGTCVSRCDTSLFPGTGCRDGYVCASLPRHNEASVVHDACVPAGFDGSNSSSGGSSGSSGSSGGNGGFMCTASDVPPTPNAGVVEPAGLDGCPSGMALVGDVNVCMDRWEAFLVEVDTDGNEAPFSPYENPAGHTVRAKSAPGAVPQAYINEIEASGACAQAGKRLCTNPEWTRACRGSDDFVYPYGNTREPGVCNDHRDVHPAVQYFGTDADWIWSELGNQCIDQQADTVALTGSHDQCVDESGKFFDLMGNLHEWIDDPAGTFRGGYYVDTKLNGNGCLYTTTAHDISHWDYSTGFRCCADP